jgi:hypothetical protein
MPPRGHEDSDRVIGRLDPHWALPGARRSGAGRSGPEDCSVAVARPSCSLGSTATNRNPREQAVRQIGRAVGHSACRVIRSASDQAVPRPDAGPASQPDGRRRARDHVCPRFASVRFGSAPFTPGGSVGRTPRVSQLSAELAAVDSQLPWIPGCSATRSGITKRCAPHAADRTSPTRSRVDCTAGGRMRPSALNGSRTCSVSK